MENQSTDLSVEVSLAGTPPRLATEKECLETPVTRDSVNVRIAVNKSVEGIRALTIDKDNAAKWNPPSLDNVGDEKVDLVFQPFAEDLELEIKEEEANRWDGKYENSACASFKVTALMDTIVINFGVPIIKVCNHLLGVLSI